MTLWNIIRDFFVRYIFGGCDSLGDFFNTNYIGQITIFTSSGEYYGEANVSTADGISFLLPNTYSMGMGDGLGDTYFITFGDWLSTTATIITLVALFVGIACLMVSLFRWIVRLVSLRG